MTLENFDPKNIPEGGVILQIPCDQLSRDDNQPRTKFRKVPLAELAESIRTQGLQQYPVVNFWMTTPDGVHLFKIKAGERRWRAHILLTRAAMTCIVEKEMYSPIYDADRALTQAAENSSREPHTHSEIVTIVKRVVTAEKKRRQESGVSEKGAVEIALRKVEKAFGKKQGWAVSYHQLGKLNEELLEMMDSEDDTEPLLKWGDAVALATADREDQAEMLSLAQKKFPADPRARSTYISRLIRERRTERGQKTKGRGSETKDRFIGFGKQLRSLGDRVSQGRTRGEYLTYMNQVLSKMKPHEVDELLGFLRSGFSIFVPLYRAAKEIRDKNIASVGLNGGVPIPDANDDE